MYQSGEFARGLGGWVGGWAGRLRTAAASGNYYVGAIADGNNVVVEGNENNNSLGQKIAIHNNADLVFSSGPSPTSANAGSTINISIQVKNQGSGGTGQSVVTAYIRAYVSNDKLFIGSVTLPALAAGEVVDVSVPVTLPAYLVANDYALHLLVDEANQIPERDEDNNELQFSMGISNGADLTVSAVTAPSSIALGNSISLSATICNGSGAAGSYTTLIYLSSDTEINASDILIDQPYNPNLAANTCVTSPSVLFTIPANLTSGDYSIIAHTDAYYQVPETNENNNTRTTAIRITGVPDLVISSITPPVTAAAGSSINIPVQIRNQGTDGTGQSVNLVAYLSEFMTGRTIPLGSVSLPTLATGGIADVTMTVTLPADLPASTMHHILVVVDEANQLTELDENNNSQQTDYMTMRVTTGADLTVSTLTAPSRAAAGEVVTVTSTVCNIGSGKAGAFYSFVYLPGVVDYLGYTLHYDGLAGNACVTTPYQITMPANLAPGIHYFNASADNTGGDWVPETNEGNNVRTAAVSVGPDLVMHAISTSASSLTRGSPASFLASGMNQGTSATTAAFSYGVYLSTDTTITTEDTPIGSWLLSVLPSIPAGVGFTEGATLTIPSTITPGTYYLGVIADIYNQQPESVETNNAFAGNRINVIAAPTVTTNPAASITMTCATLNGTINPNNEASTARFEWGATTAYGTLTATQSVASSIAPVAFSQQVCGLTPGATYHFRAVGTNATGTGYGGDAAVSTLPDNIAPSTPTGLTATAISNSRINLAWTASTDNVAVAGYKIERCSGSKCTAFTQIATSATNSYSDTGLAARTTYRYRVRAYDAAGNNSAYSGIVSATTLR